MRISSVNPVIQARLSYGNGVNFGRKVNGIDFPDEIVNEAERILENNEQVDSKKYEKDFFDCMLDVKVQPVTLGLSAIMSILGGESFNKDTINEVRLGFAIATLGLSELPKLLEGGIRKGISKINANNYSQQVKDCMIELLKEKRVKL